MQNLVSIAFGSPLSEKLVLGRRDPYLFSNDDEVGMRLLMFWHVSCQCQVFARSLLREIWT